MSFDLLDYVWKCVFVFNLSATIVICLTFLFYHIAKNQTSQKNLKLFFNLNSSLILLSAFLAFLSVLTVDPELSSACFSHFASKSNAFNFTRIFAGVYVFGFALLIFSDGFILARSSYLVKSLPELTDYLLLQRIKELSSRLKINSSFSVAISETAGSPFVWGLFRYKIAINKTVFDRTDWPAMEAVLAHELMHIRGKDSLWLLLSHLSKRILFFNPLLYFFCKRHHLLVELSADEQAIQQGRVEPKRLLDAMIKLAENSFRNSAGLLQLNVSRGFKDLKERIHSITQEKETSCPWTFPALLTLSLVACFLSLGLQAKASLANRQESAVGMICTQVKYEKIIEGWLRTKSSMTNQCENQEEK